MASQQAEKGTLFLDIECLPDYFLICIVNENDEPEYFECVGKKARLSNKDIDRIKECFRDHDRIVTFNGTEYDLPLLKGAIMRKTASELQKIGSSIIDRGDRRRAPKLKLSSAIEHIDLIKLVNKGISLKSAGLRIGSRNIQDLPVRPDQEVSHEPELIESLRKYCLNDVRVTQDLYKERRWAIALRRQLAKMTPNAHSSETIGLRESKFGEWLFEKAIGRQWRLMRKERSQADNTINIESTWEPQPWLKPKHPKLKALVKEMASEPYCLSGLSGKWVMKKGQKRIVDLGNSSYQVGVGGGHSILKEGQQGVFRSDGEKSVFLLDAASFYPNIMLNNQREPFDGFKRELAKILKARFAAKRDGKHLESDALKVGANSVFGKLSSQYSPMFDPSFFLQVTLTGQILIMDLATRMEEAGARVLQTNTDGVFVECPKDCEQAVMEAAKGWSKDHCDFVLDRDDYAVFAQRDVNAYIAVDTDGEIKARGGLYRDQPAQPLRWQPRGEIAGVAARKFVLDGTPPSETVRACNDISKFALGTKLTEPCFQDGKYIGETVRWVRTLPGKGSPLWHSSGDGSMKAVAETTDALLALDFGDETLIDKVDRDWYVDRAHEMLRDIGLHEVDLHLDKGQATLGF